MKKLKPRFPAYTDGVLRICEEQKTPSSFNGRRNPRSVDDLRAVVKLPFKTLTCREQDMEFAESMGRSLSVKVQTADCPLVQTQHSVLVGKRLYSILRLDHDKERKTMFLYLEEVRRL